MKIAIVGARGDLGAALLAHWRGKHELIACTRSENFPPSESGIDWRSCDLYSLLDAEKALAGADVAVSLVNSFTSLAALSQGSTEDLDLILADNFVRAAARAGVRHVIAVAGTVPENDLKLRAKKPFRGRLEVERIFRSGSVPWTLLRVPFVLAPGSAAEGLLRAAVKHLPILFCPAWTRIAVSPANLADLLRALDESLAAHTSATRVVTGGEEISVRGLLRAEMAVENKKRWIVVFPFAARGLSIAVLRILTKAPWPFLRDVVGSLRGPVISEHEEEAAVAIWTQQLRSDRAVPLPVHVPNPRRTRDARSVQRLPLPAGWTAADVARSYLRWMPRTAPLLLRVTVDDGLISFCLRGLARPLLRLAYSPERSSPDRQLFYVRPCLASSDCGRGRLEFRESLDHEFVLAAIHNFRPSLPWHVYRLTQALVHNWTMHRFAKFLAKRKRKRSAPLPFLIAGT